MHGQLSKYKQSGVRWGAALALCGAAWALPLVPSWAQGPQDKAPPAATAATTTTGTLCPPVAAMPSPAVLQQLASLARDRGLLWKLEHQGRTSWLYGTIHVNQQAWMLPGPTLMHALRSSDRLALELNLLDPAVLQALAQGLRAQPGAAPLPAGLQQRLAQQMEAACAGDQLNALRPEAQIITLLTWVGRPLGLDPQFGVDLVLAGAAQALGKPVLGLEAPATQLRELVSDDPATVQRSVESGLEQLEKGAAPQQLLRLAQAWAAGDAAELAAYPQWCDCLNTDAERADYARLVDGRNPAMADAIAQQLRSGQRLLVAVGALHLIGPQGLPALLAAQGFAVQPVPLGAEQDMEPKRPSAQ